MSQFAVRLFVCSALLVLLIDDIAAQLPPSLLVQKAGDCPPPLPRRVCWDSCQVDQDCQGPYKCCGTGCGGRICSRPVTARKNPYLVKAGTCPDVPEGPWFCSNMCSSDGDCRGNKKCCKNKCGAMGCYAPEA